MTDARRGGSGARPRVVLLGASNLVRAPWIVVETARLVLGVSELDVLGAFGHGRSYGQRSRVGFRSVPGIRECGLWKTLDELGEAPTWALVTDVGNDVAYEYGAERTAGWVEECVRALVERGAKVVMTGVPIVSLERFPEWQLALVRRLIFPSSGLTVAEMWRQVDELERRLREMCERYGVARVEHEADWYGVDPIHIRRRRVAAAYSKMMTAWTSSAPGELARPSLRSWLWMRRQLPESWRWFGIELGRPQPVGVLPGGGSLYLF